MEPTQQRVVYPTSRGGEFIFVRLGDGLLISRCVGYLSAECFADLEREYIIATKNGEKLREFVDTTDTTAYDSGFRDKLGAWHKTNDQKIEFIHALVKSNLLRMGINVMRLVSGSKLQATVDRDAWLKLLRAAAPHYRSAA